MPGATTRDSTRRELAIRSFWVTTDGLCWIVAVLATLFTRLQLDADVLERPESWGLALGAGVLHGAVGLALGPYMVSHVRGSFEEVTSVVRTAVITGVVLMAVAFMSLGALFVPRSVPFISTALAIVLMLAARFAVRTWRARQGARNGDAERAIVLGAGLAGRRLVHNLLHDDNTDYVPVGLLDDDRGKKRLRIEGIPVLGNRQDMARVARTRRATQLIVAIPYADAELLREIQRQAQDAELAVKVLPPLSTWPASTEPRATDLRDINLEDLLGRRAVQLDQDAIAEHLTGKVVLVTGAGGSIGSELCRQIARFDPARLVMLDRDESALHSVQLSLTGRGLLEGDNLLLADIRDADRLERSFSAIQPDVIFHAAALKHLSLLEQYPEEAWQTNVVGTLNVLRASTAAGVGTFVNISTDKAASPTSVLGRSKRMAERLTAHYAQEHLGRYVSVRFGNVLGSRGSVIPAFTEQIRQGGPVTVTHPDVERYFMLIPEACQLVLQAGAIGRDGQALVLDMGEPVKILDVARELIAMSGQDIAIQFTGLRPGEKLTEVLFSDGERHLSTNHALMSAVDVPSINPADLSPDYPAWL